METADAWLRWTRAAALAAVASLVAIWAHVGADGRLPSAAVLLLVVVALTLAALPLLVRPASLARVVLLTVGGQVLAHAALSLTGGHASVARTGPSGPPPGGSHAPPGGHAHGPHPAAAHDHAATGQSLADAERSIGDQVLGAVTHLVDDLTSAGPVMLVTHLLASVVVGAWLAAGERAVWTMLSLAWRTLVLLVAQVPPHPTPPATAGRVDVAPLLARVGAGSVVRRGPPLLLEP